MTTEELIEKLELIQKLKCETPTLEIKSAEKGCPKHLYDSLSSFSNQDDGGVIVFGVDEEQDFKEVGVYDPQDIQKKINEQCLQMEPVVRPLLTVAEKNGFFLTVLISNSPENCVKLLFFLLSIGLSSPLPFQNEGLITIPSALLFSKHFNPNKEGIVELNSSE